MSDLMHYVLKQKKTISVSSTNFGVETSFEEMDFGGRMSNDVLDITQCVESNKH
jgi:hypothetical protein